MKAKVTALVAAVFAAALSTPASSMAAEFIAISASTAKDYKRPTDAQGNPRPEAYVFGEGNFLGGTTKDVPLERYELPSLLKHLAKNLAKQRYFPASDPNDSDLLIIVHWGVTTVSQDPLRDLAIDNMNTALRGFYSGAGGGAFDPGAINDLADTLEAGQLWQNSAIARNARLLGYAGRLREFYDSNSVVMTTTERTLLDELSQERYFLVLMAYDHNAYKQKRSVLRWVTRLSVRSPGTNFGEAVTLLSEAGGNVFGTKLDKLSHVKGRLRKGEVILGELKVLGEE